VARSVPLAALHRELGASFGEFAGWLVPMVYTSTVEEHMAVRTSAGVFDISHMGRLAVRGPGALDLLEALYTKRISKVRDGFMSGPTLLLTPLARVVDDEMFYRVSGGEWYAVPNAAAADKVREIMEAEAAARGLDVEIVDLRDEYSLLALQGPKAVEAAEAIGAGWVAELKPLEFRVNVSFGPGEAFIVSRSGWTGEDGFEIWARHGDAERIFRALVEAGVKPIGIAARDTLRIEMGFVLGGHEYGEDPLRFPCALSLRYGMGAIDWGKTGYRGWEALRACRREGVRWIRVGLVMKKKHARFVPRQGYPILVEDQAVGWVTSGTFSPVAGRGVGMGYVDVRYAITGEPVEVEARGRRYEAKLSDFPLIKR